jgi:phage FluMu protein Com
MAHNWSKCRCKNCDKVEQVEQDGAGYVEAKTKCKVDGKELNFWGDEECPLRRLIETENYQMS